MSRFLPILNSLIPLQRVLLQWPLLAGLLLVGLSVSSESLLADEQEAIQVLDRMSRSFSTMNYQGSFTFQRGETILSYRLSHAVIDGLEYDRLEYMDGKLRDIVRQGHSLDCIHPGHKLMRLFQRELSGTDSGTDKAGVIRYYQPRLGAKTRVAGRPAQLVYIQPRDSHRLSYHLALDVETALLLRSELIDPQQGILERFQFVDIQIGEDIPKAYFDGEPHSHHARHISPQQDSKQMSETSQVYWKAGWVPDGFTADVNGQPFVAGDMASFTDGLAVFSIFVEPLADPASLHQGLARRGATTAYSQPLQLAGKSLQVTVVGEIPGATARRVAQSIQLMP